MFCVVVCSEDIVSNFEAEQFGKLVFLWVRPAFFLSFYVPDRVIVIENLGSPCVAVIPTYQKTTYGHKVDHVQVLDSFEYDFHLRRDL